ncbi:hypothetical protein ABLE91_16765 [Aquabacter sp. CN5-332]|uniref:hypothetical protein n=1 Tax=Aquabacter sp. CN5-332 TaxID=3156608 RepID=UPI0032B3D4CC
MSVEHVTLFTKKSCTVGGVRLSEGTAYAGEKSSDGQYQLRTPASIPAENTFPNAGKTLDVTSQVKDGLISVGP